MINLELVLANGAFRTVAAGTDLEVAKAQAQTILDHGYVTDFTYDRVDHIEIVLEAEGGPGPVPGPEVADLVGGPVGGQDEEAPVSKG